VGKQRSGVGKQRSQLQSLTNSDRKRFGRGRFSRNSTLAPYGAGICTLDAIFEYPLSWLLELTAVAA
jgi:hypothetical protein